MPGRQDALGFEKETPEFCWNVLEIPAHEKGKQIHFQPIETLLQCRIFPT